MNSWPDLEAVDVEPADEGGHPTDGSPDWSEAWHFSFFSADETLAGYARITLVPAARQAWYWAALYRAGEPLLSVVDTEVGLPRLAGSLETRGEGLWVDHNCETPLEHFSIGAEAFALGVDDPAELVGSLRGDLVPFGLDLEWETDGPVSWLDRSVVGYTMSCRIHGEILVGDEVLDPDAMGTEWFGFRRHQWGPPPTSGVLRFDGRNPTTGSTEAFVGVASPARVAAAAELSTTTSFSVSTVAAGSSSQQKAGVEPETVAVTPIAWLPARSVFSGGDRWEYLAVARSDLGHVGWLELPGLAIDSGH